MGELEEATKRRSASRVRSVMRTAFGYGPAYLLFILLAVCLCHAAGAAPDTSAPAPVVIRFGTLPVLQALPLFVASKKGFFKESGLSVKLVTFNSAMEKDVAFTSGHINGYFGDLMTPMMINAGGFSLKMVATNFVTTRNQRMFAVLAAPKFAGKSADEIAGAGVGTSSNTVLEYLVVRLFGQKLSRGTKLNIVEVRSIPIRLQMLLAGQLAAACLPEPLVTLAEMKGARVLADDAGSDRSATALAFNGRFLEKNPEVVRKFLSAVNRASDYINFHPDEVRPIMNRECKVPEPLQQSFAIPRFPQVALPGRDAVMDIYQWLRQKKTIKKDLPYGQLVAEGYLP